MNKLIKETICPLVGAGIFLAVFGTALAHAADADVGRWEQLSKAE